MNWTTTDFGGSLLSSAEMYALNVLHTMSVCEAVQRVYLRSENKDENKIK
jgi:hypothetical protein